MPIRDSSKTAKDPNRATKARAKKEKTSSDSVVSQPTSSTIPKGISSLPPFATKSGASTRSKTPSSHVPVERNSLTGVALHRADLSNVHHGLSVPEFEPNQWMAKDLFTNSSPLPETSQADADRAVLSIARKRQTLRIVRENIGLNRDVVGAATDFQHLVGDVINYSTQLVDNHTRYIKHLDAGVKQHVAGVKLAQSQEQFTQETLSLDGMRQMTPLIQEEWDERLNLRRAKINGLKEQTLNATARLALKRQELDSMLNVDLQTV